MYRHHPQTMMLKQLLGEGAIGELRYIRGSFTFTLNRPGDVRFEPTYGGGSLWDVGCYPVSLARVLAGMQPREVFGRAQHGATGIDEMFAGQLIFTDKLQAQFDCGFAAPFRTEAELVGTTGSIRVTRPFKPGASETLVLSRGDDFEQIAIDNAGELYVGEVEDMGKAIQEGTPSRVTLADSRDNTRCSSRCTSRAPRQARHAVAKNRTLPLPLSWSRERGFYCVATVALASQGRQGRRRSTRASRLHMRYWQRSRCKPLSLGPGEGQGEGSSSCQGATSAAVRRPA